MSPLKRFFLIDGLIFQWNLYLCPCPNRIFSTLIPSGVRMVLSFENTYNFFSFCLVFCSFNRTFASLKHRWSQGISTLCIYQNKESTPTYLVHISNISSKDLQLIKYRAPMEQAYNKVVSPIHVRYLYGRCPVYVRYRSGQVPDKWRTYSGQR